MKKQKEPQSGESEKHGMQLNAIFVHVVESGGGGGVGTGVVVVEQQAAGADVRAARPPGSEDLGQTTEVDARTVRYPADVKLPYTQMMTEDLI